MRRALLLVKPWHRLGVSKEMYLKARPWKKAGMSRERYETMILTVSQDLIDEIRITSEAGQLIEAAFGTQAEA